MLFSIIKRGKSPRETCMQLRAKTILNEKTRVSKSGETIHWQPPHSHSWKRWSAILRNPLHKQIETVMKRFNGLNFHEARRQEPCIMHLRSHRTYLQNPQPHLPCGAVSVTHAARCHQYSCNATQCFSLKMEPLAQHPHPSLGCRLPTILPLVCCVERVKGSRLGIATVRALADPIGNDIHVSQ